MIEAGYLDTPIGGVAYALTEGRVTRVVFMRDSPIDELAQQLDLVDKDHHRVTHSKTLSCLSAYFDGDLTALDDIEIELNGTAFQLAAWSALRQVPSGVVVSYRDLCVRIGRPNSARAMGGAMGANPVPLIVPCHRVIGASGLLTGFSSGLDLKRWLLAHEGHPESPQTHFEF